MPWANGSWARDSPFRSGMTGANAAIPGCTSIAWGGSSACWIAACARRSWPARTRPPGAVLPTTMASWSPAGRNLPIRWGQRSSGHWTISTRRRCAGCCPGHCCAVIWRTLSRSKQAMSRSGSGRPGPTAAWPRSRSIATWKRCRRCCARPSPTSRSPGRVPASGWPGRRENGTPSAWDRPGAPRPGRCSGGGHGSPRGVAAGGGCGRNAGLGKKVAPVVKPGPNRGCCRERR